MDEITKALGPWPVLQFAFGALILLGGAWVVLKGVHNSKHGDNSPANMDDQRERWEAYNRLENIEDCCFKIVEQQRTMIGAIQSLDASFRQLTAALWNRAQQ